MSGTKAAVEAETNTSAADNPACRSKLPATLLGNGPQYVRKVQVSIIYSMQMYVHSGIGDLGTYSNILTSSDGVTSTNTRRCCLNSCFT